MCNLFINILFREKERERGGTEREGQRERDRERGTEREGQRERGTEREGQRERGTERETDRQRQRQRERDKRNTTHTARNIISINFLKEFNSWWHQLTLMSVYVDIFIRHCIVS